MTPEPTWLQPLAFGGLELRCGLFSPQSWGGFDGFDGFVASGVAGDDTGDKAGAVARYSVAASLDWSGDATTDHPASVRFAPSGDSLSDSLIDLRDVSEGWEATLSLGSKGAVAHAACRPLASSAEQRRALVHSFCRVVSAMAAPSAGGVLLHGCAMVEPETQRALLFVGASGEGKTTMTRRLEGWRLLADDTVWVGPLATGRFGVSGTPFAGKEGLPRDGTAHVLGGICVLRPGSPLLSWIPLGIADAFGALISRLMWFSNEPAITAPAIEVLRRLVQSVPSGVLASGLKHDLSRLAHGLVATGQVRP